MLLAYDKYMYQETPSHIAEYRRRGCYNIVIWDKFTGWHGWSVDYVIPIIFSWAMLGLFVATKILKIKMPDYVFSFVICIFFGLAPFILCITGVTKILIPSVICIALSIISFITLVLYDGKELVLTLSKKFHI